MHNQDVVELKSIGWCAIRFWLLEKNVAQSIQMSILKIKLHCNFLEKFPLFAKNIADVKCSKLDGEQCSDVYSSVFMLCIVSGHLIRLVWMDIASDFDSILWDSIDSVVLCIEWAVSLMELRNCLFVPLKQQFWCVFGSGYIEINAAQPHVHYTECQCQLMLCLWIWWKGHYYISSCAERWNWLNHFWIS